MNPFVRKLLPAAIPMAAALTVTGACAAPVSPEGVPPSARDRAMTLQKEIAEARDKSAQPTAGLDTTPPVLKSIATSGSVNAQLPHQSIDASFSLKDDLSGVTYYTILYRSPSQQQYVYRSKRVATPLLKLTPTLDIGYYPFDTPEFTIYSEPGVWHASYFYVYDAADNYRYYSDVDLAGLGSTTFTVTNNGGYDAVGPSLASGTVLTPTIRLSKPPKGTEPGTPPYVSADLSVTDAGNGAVSGTSAAWLYFCHSNGSGGCDDYIYMYGTVNRGGLLANTMTVGTQLSPTQTLGQYVMYSAEIDDVAGNYTYYLSTAFGGTTNFANYFPTGTTIFVNQ